MNAAASINRELSTFYKRVGIALFILTVLTFAVKTFNGYSKVTPDKTYENCKVTTKSVVENGSRSRYTAYYVRIDQEETDKEETTYEEGEEYEVYGAFSVNDKSDKKKKSYLFNQCVPYSYYKGFQNYNSSTVKFFKTSYGRSFPVSNEFCSPAQAEKEYRKLDPPIFWYTAYGVGILGGCVMLLLSKKTQRTALKYEESEGTILGDPSPFDSKEEALEYFWTGKLRNDKVQKEFDRAPSLTKYGDSKFTVLMRHSGDEKRRFEEHKRNKHMQ